MRLIRAALLLGAATLPLAATARPAKDPAPAIKPIDFTERTLANGLKVYAIRDTGTSNVSVQVWYNVGSKDDPAGRSGFAHMFEHLMFKATRNLVAEQMDRLTEDVGGYNNASTSDDYTEYHEVVPANHLERLLFAEADRMSTLVVEPVSFGSERDVVKEELRGNIAQPYGKLFSGYSSAISYSRHPYARSTIGSIANLDSAGIEDVRAFHATYYRPDNAILVVAGNFDPKQLDAWVDRYFAPIKRPATPIPRVTVAEPERTKATHYTVYEANTPLPAVLISYPLPPDNDPDNPALAVLNTVLSGGESSRLYENLVYKDQLAQSAQTYLDTKQGPGNLMAFAILAGGKTADAGEAALRAQIARLRDAPVTAEELTEAKNQILTSTLRSRETAEGKGRAIATSAIIDGDPRTSDRQLAEIARVTAADVQRVARKYLRDERSAAIRYLPAESAPAGTKGDAIAVANTVQVSALKAPADMAVPTPASAAERIAPPAPGTPVAAAIPTPQEFKLANGLRVIVVEKHDLPLLSASLVTQGGAAWDAPGRAGLASLTADLMTKGTATRSATQIAREIEALGGSISSGAGWDSSQIDVTIKADQAAPALGIVADVVQHAAFAPEEIERARAQDIDGVNVALKDPASLSSLVAARAVFGDGPYGHPASGTPTALKAITRADITGAFAHMWRPQQAALILVGDITPAQAKSLSEKSFGGWKAPAGAGLAAVSPRAVPEPRMIAVDMPGAEQAAVIVSRPGIARSDPDYYAASVTNAVLGGGYSSRLNQEIRIKRGLAYGASSRLTAHRMPGSISGITKTKNPTAPNTVAIIVTEMKRLGGEPVSAAELETRKAVLIGDFGRATETGAGIASTLGDYVVADLPLDELKRFVPAVTAVDPAQVQAVAAKLFDPAAASVVIVGDAKQFLGKDDDGMEVIPADKLDLDKASLK
ncbi:M16 family metallopeptidase [Sphingomonas immobilis]|uniref:Pitrilysin family protein n=1 Tax=Sphingomonas immobilis TaxID=3063997 RepID=A0ABT9A2M2_9SPHN|nr:pitrilysin family protein [Sphingomonas sp. CA1-15]MDO7844091.1 pitrilysin family protein [Sphingomonas sp. CA1-15]